MKRLTPILCLLAFFLLAAPGRLIAQGTAFTYQGQLNTGGSAATGNYDFTFALFNNSTTNTGQVGTTLTNLDVGVTNGLFTVVLDFGANYPGASRWLAIGVRTNGGGGFIALNPLQALTPTPYAIYTPNAGAAASAGSVLATNIVGTVSARQLPASVITNGASGVTISGTFSGNGEGVTNVTLGSLSAAGAFTCGRFVFSSSPSVGIAPDWVIGADLNRNGKMDLVTANQQGGLTILINNGKGGFVRTDYTSFGDVQVVAAADVNGDGWPDLICAGYGNYNLTVMINNGNGSFTVLPSVGLSDYPQTVVMADVNGDGKLDVITSLYNGSVVVLTNNGSGGFVYNATYNAGTKSFSIVATDINGDGKVDMVCADTAGTTLAVFTNNGSGGFVSSTNLTLPNTPVTVAAADVNGDGKPDLICTVIPDSCIVFTNNSSGGFVSNAIYSISPVPLIAFATADVNGDGKPDLLFTVAKPGNQDQGQPPWLVNAVIVFTNNSSGGFGSNATYAVGNDPVFVAVVDVNGDGLPDLITANIFDNTVSVLLNTPTFNGNFAGNLAGNLTGNGNVVSGVIITNAVIAGTFNGNGNGLTNLLASQLLGGANNNLFIGTLGASTSGAANTAFGEGALNDIFGGGNNTAVGFQALYNTTTGSYNTALGENALYRLGTTGSSFGGTNNLALGYQAGFNYTGNESSNIDIGSLGVAGENNVIRIGASQTQTYIAGVINGNGGGLTNLNAAQLSNGVVPTTVLPGFQSGGNYSTVGGGQGNIVSGQWNTISGGNNNTNTDGIGTGATIGGGQNNIITNGYQPTIGGGYGNNASGSYATIGGGYSNNASGQWSSIGGGLNNQANNNNCAVPGGANNIASGLSCFAAGLNAQAINNHSFVWSDGSATTTSTANDQFMLRASGGVIIYSSSSTNAGVSLGAGSGTWASLSDRNAKNNFTPVTPRQVLAKVAALPITQWSYKTEAGVRHIGPMAQDFYAAFGVGEDNKHITTVDEDGVALAAIQGLNEKMEERAKKLEIEAKEKDTRILELEIRLARLEKLVNASIVDGK